MCINVIKIQQWVLLNKICMYRVEMHTGSVFVSGKIQWKFILKLYLCTTFCINVSEIALLTMCSGKQQQQQQQKIKPQTSKKKNTQIQTKTVFRKFHAKM